MSKSYSEKLLSPHWQRKRQDILTRDNYTCCHCGDKETTLHVHHKTYISGRQPWEYDDSNFIVLCKYCHFITEDIKGFEILSMTTKVSESYKDFYVFTNGEGVDAFVIYRADLSTKEIWLAVAGILNELESAIAKFKSGLNRLHPGSPVAGE